MGAYIQMKGKTIADIAHEYGVQIDTLRMKWRRSYPNIPFNKYRALTLEQIEVLTTDKRRSVPVIEEKANILSGSEIPNSSQGIETVTPIVLPVETREQSANSAPDYGQILFRLLFGGGVLAHAFLIAWDAAYLWGRGGMIAGSVVFLVITGSIVLMWKQRSEAENLLWFVWLLEGLAAFVHYYALYHSGTNAYGAGVTEYGTACLSVVISMCAGAMSFFYFKTAGK